MAYRQTANVLRKLAEREDAILDAARAAAAEGGMNAVQILPVAHRAGIAAGTVYRYFPAKTDLVAQLVQSVAVRELAAMRDAAAGAPGPLSALAAAVVTFAGRALADRRLSWAIIAEPVESDIDAVRLDYRKSLATEFEALIRAAMADGHIPEQDAAIAARAMVGAMLESLLGPLAPSAEDEPTQAREAVQQLAAFALRAVGVVDAHARGLVVQAALPVTLPA